MDLLKELLKVFQIAMEKEPNWPQKKTQEFADLSQEMIDEMSKAPHLRNDALVDDLRSRLRVHVKAFRKVL